MLLLPLHNYIQVSSMHLRWHENMFLDCAGTPVAPETAAGNNPSSLGAAPMVTSEGLSTPVDGQPSIASVPTRASTPATAAGNEPLPGPDGPVPGSNATAVTNGTALSAGSNLTAGNISSSIVTAGR